VTRKVEIFRAGTQTDSAGNTREWTEADLEKIASSYNPEFHEAPVCIGHPKDNAPAWAWVKKVTREGQSLFAEIGDEVAEFAEMLKKKMFKKRSISLYPDLSIRHLAFLGAQPPAVKGLKDFSFEEAKGDPVEIEFAEAPAGWTASVSRFLQGMRELVIEFKDRATADSVLPQDEIDSLKSMRADPEGGLYMDPNPKEDDMNQQEFDTKLAAEKSAREAAEAKVAQFSEELTAEKAKVATLTAEVNGIKAAAENKALSDFCDKEIAAGRMLPANKPAEIGLMKSLATQAEYEFSEGDKVVKKTPLAAYQERLSAGPKVIEFGERATKGNSQGAQDDDKLSALTRAKMKEVPGIDFAEAGRRVLLENPELNLATEVA